MTYADLIDYREKEETGIVKGYSIEFLQNFRSLEILKKVVSNDLAIFNNIEKSLLKINEPISGDFVIYGDNKIARLHKTFSGDYQISNGIGLFVTDGCSQSSGCVYDFDIEEQYRHCKSNDLFLTNELRKGRCWTFSGNQAGGERGVYYEINFKVWKLKKTFCPLCKKGTLEKDDESIDSGICSHCGEKSYFQDSI